MEECKLEHFNLIQRLLTSGEQFYISRVSGNESYFAGLSLNNKTIPVDLIYRMLNGAGINMTNKKDTEEYVKLYTSSIINSTKVCVFTSPGMKWQAKLLLDTMLERGQITADKGIHNHSMEFYRYIDSETYRLPELLSSKRILIISPFEHTIEQQKSRTGLFPKAIFPEDCTIRVIVPPQQFCGNCDGLSWQDHYELLKQEINAEYEEHPFDLCFASCGGFGLPICNHIYENTDASVIYMGGILQIMFGIIGKRFETRDDIAPYINEAWTRPLTVDTVKNHTKVENGCYW